VALDSRSLSEEAGGRRHDQQTAGCSNWQADPGCAETRNRLQPVNHDADASQDNPYSDERQECANVGEVVSDPGALAAIAPRRFSFRL